MPLRDASVSGGVDSSFWSVLARPSTSSFSKPNPGVPQQKLRSKMVSTNVVVTLVLACLMANLSESFQARLSGRRRVSSRIHSEEPPSAEVEDDNASGLNEMEAFISDNHPTASKLFQSNADAKKAFKADLVGATVFVPNEDAFKNLGSSRLDQLKDIRNEEVSQKIISYHVIDEPVSASELFNAGGVLTKGGEDMIERSVQGGLFGLGGKEDGSVMLNGSKVVKTTEFKNESRTSYVHEVDGLLCPSILWRYADQLRIPGSS